MSRIYTDKDRKTPRISVTLPEDILESVRAFAQSERRTLSNAVAYLIERGIEIHDAEQKRIAAEPRENTYTTKKTNCA